jgi:electron transport complex protein RnfG
MKYYLRIALPLLTICTVVAVLLAAVNIATRDTISRNVQKEKEAAIAALYPDFSVITEDKRAYPTGIHTVYTVTQDEELLGYAISLESRGFGGMVQMMIGIRPDGAVSGICVLSHSETPGLGSRVLEQGYLESYHGLTTGGTVDGISGATFSSNAVKNGVALALSLGLGGEDA